MPALVTLRRRLRLIFRRSTVEREMRDEMETHLDQEIADRVRLGAAPDEARRAAMVAFGGLERFKEDARDARGGRWFDNLVQDLAYSRRQMRRAPFGTIAIVGILGIGASGAGLAFAVVRAYLQRPLPVPQADRLAYVIPAPSRTTFQTAPNMRSVDWTGPAQLFAATAAWDLDGFTLVGGSAPDYVDGAWVSRGYFDLVGAHVVRGRLFRDDEYVPGNRVALISDELWRQRFGAADSAVGSVLRLHSTDRPGEEDLVTVIGVLGPQAWQVTGFQDLIRPLGEGRMFSLARLPAGISFEASARSLTTAVQSQVTLTDTTWRMSLVPALDEHVYRLRPMLRGVFAMALLFLLLSVSSVGALIIARADERAQELAVRRALGASTGRLARQMCTETGLIWAMAASLGLLATAALSPNVAHRVEVLGGVSVPAGLASVHIDATIVGFILLASLLPLAVLGLVPLIRMLLAGSSAVPTSTRMTASRSTATVRRALVVVQVTVAIALLSNAMLLVQSVQRMASTQLGFDSDNLLKSHLLLPRSRYPDGASRVRALGSLLERVNAVPGVQGATAIHPHPFRGTDWSDLECDGCTETSGPGLRAAEQTIAPNYFSTMRIGVTAGRVFRGADDSTAAPVAIISATLAQQLGGAQEALGRRVRVRSNDGDREWLTVVGVVGDVRKTFGDTLYPDLYVPFAQHPRAYFALMTRTSRDPLAYATAIRQSVATEDAAVALSDIESMTEVLRARRGPQQILASFVGTAALLGLALTGSALYAVVAYLAVRRRREFALRLALGARGSAIASLVAREGVRLLILGLVSGIATAIAGALVLRSQLFGIGAVDVPTFAATVLAVAAIAAAALAVPALRASRESPAQVLRQDG